MTIKNRYFYFLGIFVCKCLNDIAPSSLVDCFHVMDDSQLYHTRTVSNKGLIIPHPNLSICKSVLFIFKQVLKQFNNQTDSLHSFEASVTLVFFFFSRATMWTSYFLNCYLLP